MGGVRGVGVLGKERVARTEEFREVLNNKMAISMARPFDVWLTEKLKSASSDVDTDVFVSYIIGILETESSDEEREGIKELLASVVDPDIAADLFSGIIQQWEIENIDKKNAAPKEDIGDRLSIMFEKQTLATVQERKLTKEEAERKAAILAQYGQVSDGEATDSDEHSDVEQQPVSKASSGGSGVSAKLDSSDFLMVRNVNKEEVQRVEREKREKAKEEQEKKKEKDKQDRLAQKQKQQERKETEKKRTSKGEKRR
ncbi:Coiled-coil domain-containing protein 43 [Bulinus truncatus]|nr:Coiled-coil domain-containing protein 43 [Bulinus truncatus]